MLVWIASLVLPSAHVALEDERDSSRGGLASAVDSDCSGDDCSNPLHHHSIAHADPSQCPICSTQLLRVADAPNTAFALAPHEVNFVRERTARLRPVAARRVIALARGPPARPSLG